MGMSENGKIESFHVIWDRNILSSFIPKPKPLNIQQQFQARIQKAPNQTTAAWLSSLKAKCQTRLTKPFTITTN